MLAFTLIECTLSLLWYMQNILVQLTGKELADNICNSATFMRCCLFCPFVVVLYIIVYQYMRNHYFLFAAYTPQKDQKEFEDLKRSVKQLALFFAAICMPLFLIFVIFIIASITTISLLPTGFEFNGLHIIAYFSDVFMMIGIWFSIDIQIQAFLRWQHLKIIADDSLEPEEDLRRISICDCDESEESQR